MRPINIILAIVGLVCVSVNDARGQTFHLLNYTPPRGWVQQTIPDGVAYKRPSGVGLVAIYASNASAGNAAEEFEKAWHLRLGSMVPGAPPKPQIQKDGDTTAAIGAQSVNAQGTLIAVSVVVSLSRGRAQAVLTMSAGSDVQNEAAAFLDSLSVSKTALPEASSSGAIEPDALTPPPGYRSERQGGGIVLKPIASSSRTQCTYVIGSERPSSGSLETDARRAILEPIPGAQIGSYTMSMRGVGGEGWPYHIIHADVQGTNSSVNAIAVAAGPGRLQMLWGVGPMASCTGDEASLAYILNSLRPKGWTPNPTVFASALVGSWLNSQSVGIGKYRFLPDGRYEYGVATSTTFGTRETTTGSHNTGTWKLSGSTLTLTPNRRDTGPKRHIARIIEKSIAGRWSTMLLLLDTSSDPPLDVSYDRVQD